MGTQAKTGGARRDRTVDLLHAMQALSQLSYGPTRSTEFCRRASRVSTNLCRALVHNGAMSRIRFSPTLRALLLLGALTVPLGGCTRLPDAPATPAGRRRRDHGLDRRSDRGDSAGTRRSSAANRAGPRRAGGRIRSGRRGLAAPRARARRFRGRRGGALGRQPACAAGLWPGARHHRRSSGEDSRPAPATDLAQGRDRTADERYRSAHDAGADRRGLAAAVGTGRGGTARRGVARPGRPDRGTALL
jgi:hypothetical protein